MISLHPSVILLNAINAFIYGMLEVTNSYLQWFHLYLKALPKLFNNFILQESKFD